ncbi:hypothetical protein EJ03DRAFT_101430 [Teratosphaeria nubilosa]|uniref:Uncharacterized protein n=1 Tax=Teratosphaeria nubilosa TaxID=161662 RepID=A0A6G1LN18_9PEZI|nr:hypothetical protein EJ03DRAFT_101430 [Teratosphaeria nubilosa]
MGSLERGFWSRGFLATTIRTTTIRVLKQCSRVQGVAMLGDRSMCILLPTASRPQTEFQREECSLIIINLVIVESRALVPLVVSLVGRQSARRHGTACTACAQHKRLHLVKASLSATLEIAMCMDPTCRDSSLVENLVGLFTRRPAIPCSHGDVDLRECST